MMSMFSYTLDNKRYHTLNYFYKKKFGSKVFKVSLNQGLGCPNKVNGKGCIFCSHDSADFAGNPLDDLSVQFAQVKKMMEQKWPSAKYIAYFQAGTNTFAPLPVLKKNFESVLSIPDVVGISIATRSDALSKEVFDYLSELNKKTFLQVEIGLQSMHEHTLKFIKRGHSLQNFEDCIKELKKRGIYTVAHIINGLPYETKEEMIETVKYLNRLKIDGIKIHMLSVVKDTELADIYEKEKFPLLSKEEYIDIIVEQLCYLDPQVCIHRITGDPVSSTLIAPLWLTKKFVVINDIDKEMVRRNIVQGCKLI